MFTGIIDILGTVRHVEPEGAGRRLVLDRFPAPDPLRRGESVAVNGVCLTVAELGPDAFTVQAGPETLRRTNLGELRPGDRVNLERALRVGDRLGGHWVQGHVDGVGRVEQRIPQGEWETFWFACPVELAAQLVPKGSVAVDGVSLTVVDVEPARFSVAFIPYTLAHTTFGAKRPGATVNLETDILGKYVWKYLAAFRAAQPAPPGG
jgi:riboflavin synthase